MIPDDRDDLFTPTLQAAPLSAETPYRSGSLIYPAFFGGPLAVLPFARRSATRLGMPERDVSRLTLLCLGALVAGIIVVVLLDGAGVADRAQRLTLQIAGLGAYLAVARVLRGPERRHELRHGKFVKLSFWLGLAACLALGMVQALLLVTVLGIVR